jgi:hypothetical protein
MSPSIEPKRPQQIGFLRFGTTTKKKGWDSNEGAQETGMSASRPFAIVAGASSGIGFELAKRCAQEGYDLLIAADEPEIEKAAASLRDAGTGIEALHVDLATTDGVEALCCRERSAGRRAVGECRTGSRPRRDKEVIGSSHSVDDR